MPKEPIIVDCGFDPRKPQPPRLRMSEIPCPPIIAGAAARFNAICAKLEADRRAAAIKVYQAGLRAQVLDGTTLDDAEFIAWFEAAGSVGKTMDGITEDAKRLHVEKFGPPKQT